MKIESRGGSPFYFGYWSSHEDTIRKALIKKMADEKQVRIRKGVATQQVSYPSSLDTVKG